MVSLIIIFGVIIIGEWVFPRIIKDKIIRFGFLLFAVGCCFFVAVHFFNIDIVSLRYGIVPEITRGSESTAFVAKYTIAVGLLIMFVRVWFKHI